MNKNIQYLLKIIIDDEASMKMLLKLEANDFFDYINKNNDDINILLLAKTLHAGQVDKSGIDYIVHLIHTADIALKIKSQINFDIEDKILVQILLLHDSLEDEIPAKNAVSFNKKVEELLIDYGVSDFVINSIKDMSRNDKETYFSFIKRIKENNNIYSIIGKIADIMSNTNPIRLSFLKNKDELKTRYEKAFNLLTVNTGISFFK